MSKRSPVFRSLLLILAAGLATVAGVTAAVGQQGTLPPPPIGDLTTRGTIRTVVIDAGHGGEEEGVHGVAGTKEKDLTLKFAQQLKTAIETKLLLKVVLTRESDETMTVDQRAVNANTGKGDLFISLHANASVRKELRGLEVITLDPDTYVTPPPPAPTTTGRGKAAPAPQPPTPPAQIPVVGGGLRTIEPVLWDFAQLPHLEHSEMVSHTIVKRLTDAQIPGTTPLATVAPLRVLAGVNMPAVLIELGFLTNADDETALNGADVPAIIIDAIVNTIGDVRFGFPNKTNINR